MRKALTFSEAFELDVNGEEQWFDPCILLDSPLCIDPFLMLDLEEDDEFKGAHQDMVDFFQRQMERVGALDLQKAIRPGSAICEALEMPEVNELFLGYSEGTQGAGSGPGLAKLMVQAMSTAITYGLKDIKHFEEISILGTGIGPDRISDSAARLAKWRFGRYTERICAELGVPTQKQVLDRARYDLAQDRWVSVQASVPMNPQGKGAILLTPKRFLRHLPTLGQEEFAEYAERKWREAHKEQLEKNIVTFNKEKIIAAARKNEQERQSFIRKAERDGGAAYDFKRDRWGIEMPRIATEIVTSNPPSLSPPSNDTEMKSFVLSLANYFKHFIEEQKGWELLWDRSRAKGEKAVQRLMFGIVFQSCRLHNVSVDPEVNAGRGPVDFKFSTGFHAKCLLETKLSKNSKWLKGVTEQLGTYIVSDVGKTGVFLLVTYDGHKPEAVEKLEDAARSLRRKGIEIDVLMVDASRDKLSASKL